ncbi:MAG: hypothetical protein GX267_06060 [Fibrobacter sp.]|nr:hypothetical protein [Fibrobacter sp.]
MCNFSALALLDDFPLPQFSLKYPKLLLTYLALILRFFQNEYLTGKIRSKPS